MPVQRNICGIVNQVRRSKKKKFYKINPFWFKLRLLFRQIGLKALDDNTPTPHPHPLMYKIFSFHILYNDCVDVNFALLAGIAQYLQQKKMENSNGILIDTKIIYMYPVAGGLVFQT